MEIFLDCNIGSINFSIRIMVDINFKILANYIRSKVMGFIKAMEFTIFKNSQLEDTNIMVIIVDTAIDIKELGIKLSNKDL
jgi:hypothetical protein